MSRLGKTLTVLALVTPGFAHADVKSCVESHAAGQREVKAFHLKAAAELFTACGSTLACPTEIKTECAQFLREVEHSVPTVLLSARDAAGHDVTQARVYAGEQLLASELDGRSIALDPGKYSFRFVFANGEVVTEPFVIKEGERNRAVSVSAPEAERANTEEQPRAGLGAPFWIATGTSAAGLTAWGVFALLGRGRQASVEECAPRCSESARADYDAMRRNYLVSDVSLGVGLAAAGVATWLLLDQPKSATHAALPARAKFALVPTLTTSKVELTLRATTF